MMWFDRTPINKHGQLVEGGHLWILDDDGDVDVMGYREGNHNGPRCNWCGFSFCMWEDSNDVNLLSLCPGADAHVANLSED